MNVGSLFSGIGGIEHGFEQTGFTTKWFVEKDPYAQIILRKHFPNTIIYDDVTTLDFTTVPQIDILTGGFPCQDISNAGKRVGIEGSRSSLWKYYLKAIGILRPKYIFIENVSALINRGLDVVLADLAKVGYDAEWYCVPASAVGAPHQRDRIFIIAYSNDNGWDSSNKQDRTKRTDFLYEERYSTKIYPERVQQQFGTEQDGKLQPISQEVANTNSRGNEEGNRNENNRREKETTYSDKSQCSGWWKIEPSVGRVANDVPFRMERIRCLGNAVVPAVAEVFAQAIKEMNGGE